MRNSNSDNGHANGMHHPYMSAMQLFQQQQQMQQVQLNQAQQQQMLGAQQAHQAKQARQAQIEAQIEALRRQRADNLKREEELLKQCFMPMRMSPCTYHNLKREEELLKHSLSAARNGATINGNMAMVIPTTLSNLLGLQRLQTAMMQRARSVC